LVPPKLPPELTKHPEKQSKNFIRDGALQARYSVKRKEVLEYVSKFGLLTVKLKSLTKYLYLRIWNSHNK